MGAIWSFFKYLVIFAIALGGALFALRNSQPLSVDFILAHSPELSLGLWLILFLALGALLGLLTSSLMIAGYRRRLARLEKAEDKS
ncbi:MAG: lipopolysaccharide assembly protein LapA domain-containing protein [Porticoccaceae bacterium]